MKKTIHMYVPTHLPNFMLIYLTQKTKLLVKKHKRQLKLPGWKYYAKLSYATVQSIQIAIFVENHYLQQLMSFQRYICSMATKFIGPYF
jgi:hypothetical protein